jgi:hypothetical protein
MKKHNADKGDGKKEAAKNQDELDCCQAVQPGEEPLAHG